VLNREGLARHRGSVLGGRAGGLEPGTPGPGGGAQPGQKAFETQVWDALRGFDPDRPVFVESESRRIGRLSIPPGLFEILIDSPCLRIAASLAARVEHLLERYGDIYGNPEALDRRMEYFLPQHGHKTVEQWRRWIAARDWAALAGAMCSSHYDPAYRRGGDALYRRAGVAPVLAMESLDRNAIMRAAQAILQTSGTGNA